MIEVELPDGSIAEFPDHMQAGEIERVLRPPISTMTSKPIPTGEEKIQQTGQAWRSMGPIVGDIAGTAAMEALPIPGSGALWGLGKRAVGAGLGSMAGSVAGQKMAGGPVSMREAGTEGAIGALGEPALRLAGKPIAWAGRKVAKPALELMSDLTVTGSALKRKMRDKIISDATTRATDFVNDIAPAAVKNQENVVGLKVMVESAIDETRSVYDMYEHALREMAQSQGGKVSLDDTIQALVDMRRAAEKQLPGKTPAYYDGEVIRAFGYTPGSAQGRMIKKILSGDGSVGPEVVADLMATVFKGSRKSDLKAVYAQKEALKELVLTDLDKIPGAGQLKREADQAFKDLKRFDMVRKIYDRAMVKNKATGESVVQPMALAEAIYEKKRIIMDQMPDLWPKLEAEAKHYIDIAPQFRKQEARSGGSAGALAYAAGGLAGPGAATALMGPVGIPVAETFGMASAYALMNDTARRRLAKVLSAAGRTTGKTALHLGGRELMLPEGPMQ